MSEQTTKDLKKDIYLMLHKALEMLELIEIRAVLEGFLVAKQAANMLFAELDILHEGQLVDHGRGVIVAIEIGNDVRKVLEQGQVGPFVNLLITRFAGLQKDMIEGMVAILTGLPC